MSEKRLSMSGGTLLNDHVCTSGRLFGWNSTAQSRASGRLQDAMTTSNPPAPQGVAHRASSSPPVYGSIQVALHVGGERYPIDPISAPVFRAGPGLSLDDLHLAVDRLHAAYLAGDRPWQGGWDVARARPVRTRRSRRGVVAAVRRRNRRGSVSSYRRESARADRRLAHRNRPVLAPRSRRRALGGLAPRLVRPARPA
jgi:hypothetical protein